MLLNMPWFAQLAIIVSIQVQPCVITVITRGEDEILLAKMHVIPKARCMV